MKSEIYETEEGTILKGIDFYELNLDLTLVIGQSFRWTKHSEGFWYGTIGDRLVVLHQNKKANEIFTNLKGTDILTILNYLDIGNEYNKGISSLNLTDYEKELFQKNQGTHILNQPLIETMVAFVISQQNNMKRIRNSLNAICSKCTEPVQYAYQGISLEAYPFPDLDQLSTLSEEDYRGMGLGYRAPYLVNLVNILRGNRGILMHLFNLPYPQLIRELKAFKGIGDKVANCIALFGFHHLEAFPVDTHIARVLREHYPNESVESITLRLGNYAGVVQQYMYASETTNK